MKDWLKFKTYLHFSRKYNKKKHGDFIRKYVSNAKNIIKHKFFPFIHYTIVESRFRRNVVDGKRDSKRTSKKKNREIFYSNHLDSFVFSYYGYLITKELGKIYSADTILDSSVLAYRKIPSRNSRNKCNIDFAKEIFSFVKESSSDCVVICLDIEKFFDSLVHKKLKQKWAQLFHAKCLPLDHYKVFKAITKFTFVEISDLLKEFHEYRIKKMSHIKNKNIDSFCRNGEEFRDRVWRKKLINYNKIDQKTKLIRDRGIPQGSPISAVLSNLYMLDFDKEMSHKLKKINGLYRRYSDDIIIVCTPEYVADIEDNIYSYIKDSLGLVIQKTKTQKIFFTKNPSGFVAQDYDNGKKCTLSYLGFEFDGKKILLRQKGVSLYYRKVKRLIRRGAVYALYAKKRNMSNFQIKKDAWIYRRKIYTSKTHLGSKRKKVNNKVYWGNYLSYVYLAAQIMEAPEIKAQLRNHWKITEQKISHYKHKYKLPKTPSSRNKQSRP